MRPEFFGARDVRHGLATDTPLQQCLESIFGQLVEFVFRMGEEVTAWHVDRLAQQYFGVESRRVAGGRKPLNGIRNGRIESQ